MHPGSLLAPRRATSPSARKFLVIFSFCLFSYGSHPFSSKRLRLRRVGEAASHAGLAKLH
jgi:hypothetical protein